MAAAHARPLAAVRDRLFVGDLAAVIDAVPALSGTLADPAEEVALRVYYFLALAASGRAADVAAAVQPDDPAEMLAALLLANTANVTDQNTANAATVDPEAAAQQAAAWLAQGLSPSGVLVCSIILLRAGLVADAARALAIVAAASPDCAALLAYVHLRLARTDLAALEVPRINALGAPIVAQIVEAWVGQACATADKARSTFYLFEELAAAHPPPQPQPAAVACGAVLAKLQLGELAAAERQLDSSLAASAKSPTSEAFHDLLALAITVYSMNGKEQRAETARNKLREVAPSHPILAHLTEQEAAIDAVVKDYVRFMK